MGMFDAGFEPFGPTNTDPRRILPTLRSLADVPFFGIRPRQEDVTDTDERGLLPLVAAAHRRMLGGGGYQPLGQMNFGGGQQFQFPQPSGQQGGLGSLGGILGGLGGIGNILSAARKLPTGGIGNLFNAVSGGHLSSAAATGPGALARSLPLAWEYGTPGNVPAMFDMAGPGIEALLGAYPTFGAAEFAGGVGGSLGGATAGFLPEAAAGGLGAGGLGAGLAAAAGPLALFAGLGLLGNKYLDRPHTPGMFPTGAWGQYSPSTTFAGQGGPTLDMSRFANLARGIIGDVERPGWEGPPVQLTTAPWGNSTPGAMFSTPGYYVGGNPASVIQDEGQALDAYEQALRASLSAYRPPQQAPEIAFGNSGMNGGGP